MAINQYQPTRSGIQGIAEALSAIGQIYGMKQASASADALKAHTASENQQGELTQQQINMGKAGQAQLAKEQDPNSMESTTARQVGVGTVQHLIDTGDMDPNNGSALLDSINHSSAYQLKNSLPLQNLMEFDKNRSSIASANARAAPQIGKLNEQKNENSISAGNDFDKDPIISASKTNLNSIAKSSSILTNSKTPLTAKGFALAYNDYINATAPGGAATEGKVNREIPDTWVQKYNDFMQNAGDTQDMRSTPQGKALVDDLLTNMGTVKNDLSSQIADQADSKFNSYASADPAKGGTNAQVWNTVKGKLKQYAPGAYDQRFGNAPKQNPQFSQQQQAPISTATPPIQSSPGNYPDPMSEIKAELQRRAAAKTQANAAQPQTPNPQPTGGGG